jgi:hypothetical protein
MADIRRADRIQQLAGNTDLMSDASETGIALVLQDVTGVIQGREVILEVAGGAKSLQACAEVVYVKTTESGSKQVGFKYHGMSPAGKQTMAEIIDAYSKGVPIRAKIIR